MRRSTFAVQMVYKCPMQKNNDISFTTVSARLLVRSLSPIKSTPRLTALNLIYATAKAFPLQPQQLQQVRKCSSYVSGPLASRYPRVNWKCRRCLVSNPAKLDVCSVCGNPRPWVNDSSHVPQRFQGGKRTQKANTSSISRGRESLNSSSTKISKSLSHQGSSSLNDVPIPPPPVIAVVPKGMPHAGNRCAVPQCHTTLPGKKGASPSLITTDGDTPSLLKPITGIESVTRMIDALGLPSQARLIDASRGRSSPMRTAMKKASKQR